MSVRNGSWGEGERAREKEPDGEEEGEAEEEGDCKVWSMVTPIQVELPLCNVSLSSFPSGLKVHCPPCVPLTWAGLVMTCSDQQNTVGMTFCDF